MSDEEEVVAEGEDGEEAPKKKMAGKTLVLFIILPALLVLGGGGAAVYFLFLKGDPKQEEVVEAEKMEEEVHPNHIDPSKLLFYPIPEILVNLNSSDHGNTYLKINVELELRQGADVEVLDTIMPRVIDKFQVYLRELRLEDLRGSSGMFRVKEELLRRVNLAVRPLVVHDVLFKELIIQ